MEQALAIDRTGGLAQVAGNLTRREGDDLEKYARTIEITRATLCGLLVLRELRLNRVRDLVTRYPGSGTKRHAARVTARVSVETKVEFAEHVAKARIGSDDAAAVIFRAELDEGWLSASLSYAGNQP